jgi:1,4-dihydroxy-2-naphthoate octaprenyltransferase
MALAIPFDIRDLKVDSADKRTLPQALGISGSKFLASVFLATSFAIQFLVFQSTFNFFQPFYFVMVLALILFANPNRKELYFSGLIDGVLVLYLVTFI